MNIAVLADSWLTWALCAASPDVSAPHLDVVTSHADRYDVVIVTTQWPDTDHQGMSAALQWQGDRVYAKPAWARLAEACSRAGSTLVWWDLEGGTGRSVSQFEQLWQDTDLVACTATTTDYPCPTITVPFGTPDVPGPVAGWQGKTAIFPGRDHGTGWPNRRPWIEMVTVAAQAEGWRLDIAPAGTDGVATRANPIHTADPVPYRRLPELFAKYSVVVSHNLIDDDETMCSLRVPYAARSGRPILTNNGGLANSLADSGDVGGAGVVETYDDAESVFKRFGDEAYWAEHSAAARRWSDGHLWADRLATLRQHCE